MSRVRKVHDDGCQSAVSMCLCVWCFCVLAMSAAAASGVCDSVCGGLNSTTDRLYCLRHNHQVQLQCVRCVIIVIFAAIRACCNLCCGVPWYVEIA